MIQGTDPLAGMLQRSACTRAPDFFDAARQTVLAGEAPVVLVPLPLQRLELGGRDAEKKRRCIIAPACDEAGIARLGPFYDPFDVLVLEWLVEARAHLCEKLRIVGKLLVAMPFMEPVEAPEELIFLGWFEIEILVGFPRGIRVELAVTESQHAATRQHADAANDGEAPQQVFSREGTDHVRFLPMRCRRFKIVERSGE